MSLTNKKVIKTITPNLQIQTELHPVIKPKEINTDLPKLQRVARPLRHVKFIPLKQQVFTTRDSNFYFSYKGKIKLPIPDNKLVVQVNHVALNPIDLKIKNGYTNTLYGEIGIGREYCGTILHVGEKINYKWHLGEKVMGIYYHPNEGKGSLQNCILVDPNVDPIILKPDNLTDDQAAGSFYCLGTAFNLLNKLSRDKYLKIDSNILINGGTSSVSMFAIQLLKNYFKVNKKIVIVTSSNGPDVLKREFPQWQDQFIFINYNNCRGKSSKPLRQMLKDGKINDLTSVDNLGNEQVLNYTQGKFDIVLDFIGGYDIIAHSNSLIHSRGVYLTTVGDYVANYNEDIFNSWDNPSANARKMVGSILWSFRYFHYHFDTYAKYSTGKNNWIETCGDLLKDGTVRCIIDKKFDWKDTNEAISYLKTQRAQGKIILEVEEF